VADFFEKNNMSTIHEAEVHQQTEIRVGCLVDKFEELHYNDWRSLLALTEDTVAVLIPDQTMRKKFTGLIRNLPRNN
jgi:hypothetical protein